MELSLTKGTTNQSQREPSSVWCPIESAEEFWTSLDDYVIIDNDSSRLHDVPSIGSNLTFSSQKDSVEFDDLNEYLIMSDGIETFKLPYVHSTENSLDSNRQIMMFDSVASIHSKALEQLAELQRFCDELNPTLPKVMVDSGIITVKLGSSKPGTNDAREDTQSIEDGNNGYNIFDEILNESPG